MKRYLFLYLFIFSALIALFIYINSAKELKKRDIQNRSLNQQLENVQTVLDSCENQAFDLSYFKLENHDDAMAYFEDQGFSISLILPKIKNELYDTNLLTGKQHPLIPYEATEGRKLIINKSRFLNHKWLIVDFSDGKIFGEALIAFFIDKHGRVEFELIKSTLYPSL